MAEAKYLQSVPLYGAKKGITKRSNACKYYKKGARWAKNWRHLL